MTMGFNQLNEFMRYRIKNKIYDRMKEVYQTINYVPECAIDQYINRMSNVEFMKELVETERKYNEY